MSQPAANARPDRRLNLLKTLPGFAVSAFFLWWTFFRRDKTGARGFDPAAFHGLHLVHPAWLLGIVFFTVAGYTLRCFRCFRMLRAQRARFAECARVFITSLAANNVLPLRIGDVMRIFSYAGDLNATPSIVLSTVILEKLLDIFSLAILFVITMHFGRGVPPHVRTVAEIGVAISTAGLLILVFGARTLEAPLERAFARSSSPLLKKLEHWLMLAIACIRGIGVLGTLSLMLISFAAWACEGMLYVSAARLIGLATDAVGPWQAVAEANLSFLIPSSPGGIGPFELACKDALMRHGSAESSAALFGLMIHAWLFVVLTAAGGIWFFVHRARLTLHRPLLEELETLPPELP